MARKVNSDITGTPLVEIYSLMDRLYREFKDNKDDIQSKIASKEQFLIKIYDQNEYREKGRPFIIQEAADVYAEEKKFQDRIRDKIFAYYEVAQPDGTHLEEMRDAVFTLYIRSVHALFQQNDWEEEIFDARDGSKRNSREITEKKFLVFANKVREQNILQDLLSGQFGSFRLRKGKQLRMYQSEMKTLLVDYFKSYNFVSNYSGSLAAIYKNNGETFQPKEDGKIISSYYNKNLISLSYIKKKQYTPLSEKEKSVLSSALGIATSFFGDKFVAALRHVPGVSEIIAKLDSIKFDLFERVKEVGNYAAATVLNKNFELQMGEIQSSVVQNLRDLYTTVDHNIGFSDEIRNTYLPAIGCLIAIFAIESPYGIIASILYNAGTAFLNDHISSKNLFNLSFFVVYIAKRRKYNAKTV